jgi:HPt (histidine-containing phosphotransfer) domain-containing protein
MAAANVVDTRPRHRARPRKCERQSDDPRTNRLNVHCQPRGDKARLATLQEAGDWPSIRALAHDLKGSAGSIGAEELAASASALQSAAGADATAEAIDRCIRVLVVELTSLTNGLRAALDASSPASDPTRGPAPSHANPAGGSA